MADNRYNKWNNNWNNNKWNNNKLNNNKPFNNINNKSKIKISSNSEYYINPYNFITLPKACNKKSYKEWQGNLTGYMECTLKAETPIIIPDTEHIKTIDIDGGKKHNEYQFFNYQQNNGNFVIPVIPGSEIRGMLRSDYETFTNSCMSTLNEDINFIARTSKKTGNLPGILEKDSNGNWTLYKATRYSLHTCRKNEGEPRNVKGSQEAIYFVNEKNQILLEGKKYKTGDKINFKAKISGTSVLEIGTGEKTGILFIGETGGKKANFNIHDSIFVKENEIVEIENLNDEVKKLEAIFDMYNDEAFNKEIKRKNKIWYDGYDIKDGKILPVWYSMPSNKRTYLSLASIGKEAYHRKISELVGDFMPCIDKQEICNCCNLFGFMSEKDADSSKIRVSDAIYYSNENPYENKMTIKELAGPHMANATFYALYAPTTGFQNMPQTFDFNYDFKIDKDGRHLIPSGDISIRGRKHYWHHNDIENAITNERTVRNCTITPVKINSEFSFKIYFNNINKQNLNELISIINLKYGTKNLSHKIGMGKPLGFGSCKIKVENVYLKNVYIDRGKLKYKMEKYNFQNVSLENFENMDSISMQEALRIYDFDYIKKNYPDAKVQYPIGRRNGKENSMLWFTLNKSVDMKNTYVIMVLPRIIDGKDENGNEKLKLTDIKVNGNIIGKTHGLLLPKYEK